MNYNRKIWKGLIKLWKEHNHCMILGSSKETLACWYREANGYYIHPKILRDSLNKAVLSGNASTYKNENFVTCFELTRRKRIVNNEWRETFARKSIYCLHLSGRANGRLRHAGIKTIHQLINYTVNLLKIPGLGVNSYEEIKIAVEKRGFKLKDPVANLPWNYLNDFNWSYLWPK